MSAIGKIVTTYTQVSPDRKDTLQDIPSAKQQHTEDLSESIPTKLSMKAVNKEEGKTILPPSSIGTVFTTMLETQSTENLNVLFDLLTSILNDRASKEVRSWTPPTDIELNWWRNGKIVDAIQSYRASRPTIDIRVVQKIFRFYEK
jgi:hypothetical protein